MISFIISINKISLLAFLVTLGYLIYEIYLFKKEQKIKKNPIIPQFKEGLAPEINNATVIISKNQEAQQPKKNWPVFVILICFLIFFAFLSLTGFYYQSTFSRKSNRLISPIPTVIEKIVESSGILIYDKNFRLLENDDLNKLSSGSSIIIGIKTIPQTDIDKARIRINKNYWEITDETTKFDKKNQVYYLNYVIASGESQLKIEGQLHSKTDGWLGE